MSSVDTIRYRSRKSEIWSQCIFIDTNTAQGVKCSWRLAFSITSLVTNEAPPDWSNDCMMRVHEQLIFSHITFLTIFAMSSYRSNGKNVIHRAAPRWNAGLLFARKVHPPHTHNDRDSRQRLATRQGTAVWNTPKMGSSSATVLSCGAGLWSANELGDVGRRRP